MRFQAACAGALALALVVLGAGGAAHAHHSFAMFDLQRQVTVSGTVKQFQWTNPHAYIQLVAKDAQGRDVEWSMEMGAPMYLYARGWRPRTLRAGMEIKVVLNPLRNGRPGGVVRDVTTADGRQIGTNLVRSSLAAAITAALMLGAGPALAQDAPAATAARVEAFAKLPYWPGPWVSEQYQGTTIGGTAPPRPAGSPPLQRLNGFNAPYNEEGRARQAEAQRTRGGRRADGWGYPMMMDAATPFQVTITPEETVIINAYGESRHIYTDGRPLPPKEDMWPTVWGTSIGHWEGDTLVIETVQVQMPYTYFHGGPTFSEEARYFERLRLDGDQLVLEFRVEDPVTLTEPWSATIRHIREQGYDRMVRMDFSNDRTGQENGVNTIEPPADETGS